MVKAGRSILAMGDGPRWLPAILVSIALYASGTRNAEIRSLTKRSQFFKQLTKDFEQEIAGCEVTNHANTVA